MSSNRFSAPTSKTFFLRYQDAATGRRRRYSIGRYPGWGLAEARAEATRINGAIAKGRDPQATRQADRDSLTVGEVVELYFAEHGPDLDPAWAAGLRGIFGRHILPRWAHRPIRGITAGDVRTLCRAVKRHAPRGAISVHRAISGLFAWAIEWEDDTPGAEPLVAANPVPSSKYLNIKPQTRRIVLQEDEIVKFWAAMKDHKSPFAAAFQMILVTAQRPSMVLRMRWQDIADHWWTIPPELTKSKLSEQYVYLSGLARQVLDRAKGQSNPASPWVFSHRVDPVRHMENLKNYNRPFRAASGIPTLSPKVLQKTAATLLGSIRKPDNGEKLSKRAISRVLHHAEAGITDLYELGAHKDDVQEALSLLGARIEALLGGARPPSSL